MIAPWYWSKIPLEKKHTICWIQSWFPYVYSSIFVVNFRTTVHMKARRHYLEVYDNYTIRSVLSNDEFICWFKLHAVSDSLHLQIRNFIWRHFHLWINMSTSKQARGIDLLKQKMRIPCKHFYYLENVYLRLCKAAESREPSHKNHKVSSRNISILPRTSCRFTCKCACGLRPFVYTA